MEQLLIDNVVGPVVRFLTGHIKKHVGYATCSTKHVNNMRSKMDDLDNKIAEVNRHNNRNHTQSREIATGVPVWLNNAEAVKKNVESTSGDDIGCLNLKERYRAGKKACEDAKTIEELITKYSEFVWTDALIPTRMVDSVPATSTPSLSSSRGDDFKSREKTFNEALKLLQQDNKKSQVIALCGTGGVGKTTMMKQLEAHEDVKKLYQILKVTIGAKPNLTSVQHDISLVLVGEPPQEKTVAARADSLCRKFNATLENIIEGKKLLVILDDVWQDFKLEYIGLPSPMPDRIKLLLTSRYSDVCKQIAFGLVIETVAVNLLDKVEAHDLFSRTTGVSDKDDHDLYQIGCDIADKCGRLPFAINLIGNALKSTETRFWRGTLNRLKNHQLDDKVQEIVKISYELIKDEEKKIFLHCSLFPEDYDIPIEDLTRYAWGLKLLKGVSTLGEARDTTYACVKKLINANLLMSSDQIGCVKVHDIVLSFMLGEVSEKWTVEHGSASELSEEEKTKSCQSLSLTCTNMSEIPIDFRCENLSHLQLMNGDLSFKFHQDFYQNMENLKVIAYYKMQYPLLPTSLQCSTNLKSLCLHGCKLMFDISFVECLVNLEVLSFADCGIRKLPSRIGNLVKLKLLDLTGCVDLHIEDGVFKNLQKLEELYMRVSYGREQKAVRFTDANFKELKMLSKHLSALEVEFVEEVAQLDNLFFEKLDKFKIALGCLLEDEYDVTTSYENTLKLVTDSSNYLVDRRIDVLFKKTEKLNLQVKDMTRLEDILSVHPCDHRVFGKLRDLEVSNCANLKYLFPMSVASGLTILERLKISSCPNLETLLQNHGNEKNNGKVELPQNHGNEINNVGDTITFGKLKSLCLEKLPKLESLFLVDNVVELPQLVELEVDGLPNFTSIYHDKNNLPALLYSQVRVSELKKLKIKSMENLKQIWDVLPTNRMQLLNHLEMLVVDSCGSIKVIFDLDVECIGQLELVSNSRLKSIEMFESEKVGEKGKIKGGENIRFEKLKFLSLKKLPNLESLFLVDNVVELPQLVELEVDGLPNFTSIYPDKNNTSTFQKPFFNSQVKVSKLEKLNIKSMENLKQIWALSNPMRLLDHLQWLKVSKCGSIEEIFNIDLGCVDEVEQVSKSRLRSIHVVDSENLRVVWRIKGDENNFSSRPIRGFEAVERIFIGGCRRFRNVFTTTNTSTITKFDMSALTDIEIFNCGVEEVEKERDDDISAAVAFPSNLMHSFPNLQDLNLWGYNGVEVVFETESSPSGRELVTTTINQQPLLPKLQVLKLQDMKNVSQVWKCSNRNQFLILQKQSSFHNLTTIGMWKCNRIKYLFSPLMAKLLSNLKTIVIRDCGGMEEVVSRRDDEDEEEITTSTTTFFPHLHSLTFTDLKNLKRIGGGAKSTIVHDQFKVVPWSLWQNSTKILIDGCESLMEVFETQEMNNSSGDGITSTTTDERNGGTNNTSLAIPRLENFNVPQLSKLKKLVIGSCALLQHVFTFSTLESLEQLEELMIKNCDAMKVIVQEENGGQRKHVKFPLLKAIELYKLPNLEGFFLGMDEFEWPLLEKVMINECPQLMVFTCGQATTPKLKYIHTSLGKYSLECDLNSYVTRLHQTSLSTSESTSWQRLPAWSFHNLIELHMDDIDDVECIIPSTELLQLQKLESIHSTGCDDVVEVFEVEAMEGTNSEESQTIAQLPNLTQIELYFLPHLKYIWKSNRRQRRVLAFLNLTTLTIHQCEGLEHAFSSSMVGSLQKLQDLHISDCERMEVIIKEEEEECDTKVKEAVMFPCLKSLKLKWLPSLEGIWLGKDDFPFPSLHTLEIKECPELKVFTKGGK